MTTDRHGRLSVLFVTGLLVLTVISGFWVVPVAAVQGTGVAGGNGGTATFNQSTITQNRGDVATIPLNLTDTANATVTVGSEAVNYKTNVTVDDSDANGRVTLFMNTYVAGTAANETGVYHTANDTVVATNRTTGPLDAPLEASTYNLSVAVDGHETDTATLRLTRPKTGELVTWTSPAADFDNTTNASEVAAAVNGGRITTTDTVATGDVLVNQFKISGVYGALAATNFSRLMETGALDFSVEQTNPETNRPPKRLDVNRSLENDSIRVIPDERNDVLYVDVDTGTAVFDNGTPTAGDEFKTTLRLNAADGLAGSGRSVTANVTLVGAELGLGEVSLSADSNQTVTGTTSAAPGSEVTVRLQRNGTSSFAKSNTTTVKPNGSFTATFNLSAVAAGTTVAIRADGPLNTTDRTTATVRGSQSNNSASGTASLVLLDQQTTGKTVRIKNVTLPEGGFVVVNTSSGSTAPAGSPLGVSSYLENGTNRNVTVTLDHPLDGDARVVAVAHTDTNENQVYDFSSSNGTEDRPYTAGGSPVTATARLTVRNATTAASAASAHATNASGAADTNATGGNGTAGAVETTNGIGPGFGLVAVVLAVVVAGVAGLAARRAR